jgi:WD40 repeat protein
MTSHACIAWDNSGTAYTGGANAKIYVWKGRNASATLDVHEGGFICSMKWCDGKLYSGGRDGNVCITDTSNNELIKRIQFGCLLRAVDCYNGTIVVGTRKGTIYKCDEATEVQKLVMESHSDGEVWGLGLSSGNIAVTTADDN